MLSSDHPLAVELWTLRTNLDKYKEESHTAWLKLQQETESNEALRYKFSYLDDENLALRGELHSLRGFLAAIQSTGLSQSNQEQLEVITHSLTQTQSALVTAQQTTSNAYELLARSRTSEEEVRLRAREMETMWRKEHEEKKLIELVVNEYATLVRNMTNTKSRSSTASSRSSVSSPGANAIDAIMQGKSGISKLFEEFAKEVGHLEKQLAGVRLERDRLKAELDAERAGKTATAEELAKARTEVMRVKENIERYMQFSQSTLRHNSDLIDSLRAQLDQSQSREMRIRQAFQNVTLDLARESAGRREEIKLRMKSLVPAHAPASDTPSTADFANGNGTNDEDSEDVVGRIIAAECAVEMLLGELERETERRLQLEKAMAYQTWEVDDSAVNGEPLESEHASHTPKEMKDLPLVPEQDPVETPPSPPARASAQTTPTFTTDRASKADAFLDDLDRQIDEMNVSPVAVNGKTSVDLSLSPSVALNEVPVDVGDNNGIERASSPVSPSSTVATAQGPELPSPPIPSSLEVTSSLAAHSTPENHSTDTLPTSPQHLNHDHPAASSLLLSQQAQPNAPAPPPAEATVSTLDLPQPTPSFPSLSSPNSPALSADRLPALQPPISSTIPHAETFTDQPSDLAPEPLHPPEDPLATLQHIQSAYASLLTSFAELHHTISGLLASVSPQHHDLLQIALERINDYNEDARVELEIRMKDGEKRIQRLSERFDTEASGVKPGAGRPDSVVDLAVEADRLALTEEAVLKAFERKLVDVKADVGVAKVKLEEARTRPDNPVSPGSNSSARVPDSPATTPQAPQLQHSHSLASLKPTAEPPDLHGHPRTRSDQSSSPVPFPSSPSSSSSPQPPQSPSWKSWIPRPTTPSLFEAETKATQERERVRTMTFGSVMTSPRPRVGSGVSLPSKSDEGTMKGDNEPGSAAREHEPPRVAEQGLDVVPPAPAVEDPFSSFGFKITMPVLPPIPALSPHALSSPSSSAQQFPAAEQPASSPSHISSSSPYRYPTTNGSTSNPRIRTLSTLGLGLGPSARGRTSSAFGRFPSAFGSPSSEHPPGLGRRLSSGSGSQGQSRTFARRNKAAARPRREEAEESGVDTDFEVESEFENDDASDSGGESTETE